MAIKGESTGILEGSQFGGSYETPAFTASAEALTGGPHNVSVHAVLSRVAAAEAIIGVMSFTSESEGTTTFGDAANPETWAPMIFCKDATNVVIGISVARGAAKGYWVINYWD